MATGKPGTAVAVGQALAWLERKGTKRNREGMARYGIVSSKVFGVSVANVRVLAKQIGRNHDLAEPLWRSGWLEARMLVAFIAEPERLTSAQMDRWARDFDNWALCDTMCMHLFDRTPIAWTRIRVWSRRRDEFVKRAAFALIASLALHDKAAPDSRFAALFPLIESAAHDDRNFVRKGVSWALRSIGNRSVGLREHALTLATRLAESESASARWVGRDTIRDLHSAATMKRIAKARKQAHV